MMPDCEVIRSTTVKLDPSMRWNLKLDFNGHRPFDVIELEDKIIAGATISQCKNYNGIDDAIVVVFELKNRNQS